MATNLFRTTELFLQDEIETIRANGSKITDFSEGSVTRSLFEAIASELSSQSLIANQALADSLLQTATGEALDAKAGDYFVTRNAAVPATGVVRISRPATGAAVTIPAGWSLLQTVPAPGQTPVQFITTDAAVFSTSDLQKDVPAAAVQGGVAGNVVDQTPLLPLNPVLGFSVETGFKAQGDFANGVEAEADDAFRARIETTVQGRARGTAAALQAAALAVPGVFSASVLRAGDTRANGSTVAAGSVEVYYEGASGLLSQVDSAVKAAATLDQNVSTFQATAERMVVNLTTFILSGVDPVAYGALVSATLQANVNAVAIAGTVRYSDAIRSIDALDDTVSVTIPFTDFRKFTTGGGTASDVVLAKDRYPSLAAADVTVAVNVIS